MPAAAVIGSWLFAHSGYVSSPDYLPQLAGSWSRDDRYALLREPGSIVGYHDWWKRPGRRSAVKANLAAVGLDGVVFGHDPAAFGASGTIAVADGWMTKLDTGLKAGFSRGMLLRCDVREIARGPRLAMNEGGKPTCRAVTPDGAVHDLPVR